MSSFTVGELNAILDRLGDVASHGRRDEYPPDSLVRRLNRVPVIDDLRVEVEHRNDGKLHTILENLFKKETGYPAGFAISLIATVIDEERKHSLFLERWNELLEENQDSVDLRCFLLWRLGDTMAENLDLAEQLYTFITKHRTRFDMQQIPFWDDDAISSLLSRVFGDDKKVRYPWSKRWLYLCCLPGVLKYRMSADFETLVERAKDEQNKRWRRIAVLILRLATNQKQSGANSQYDEFVMKVARDTLHMIEESSSEQ